MRRKSNTWQSAGRAQLFQPTLRERSLCKNRKEEKEIFSVQGNAGVKPNEQEAERRLLSNEPQRLSKPDSTGAVVEKAFKLKPGKVMSVLHKCAMAVTQKILSRSMSLIQAEKSEVSLLFDILSVQKQTNQQRKKKDKIQHD